jgi:hypothetical protein
MGAALVRICWNVQEENSNKNDQYDYESTDNTHQYDYYYQENQLIKNSNIYFIQRQSL